MTQASLSFESCKVLVVEDEPVQALDLACSLRGLGCTVLGPAPSRSRARDLLAQERPNLVLLDMVLEDGIAVPLAKELKAAELPFTAITGWDHLLEASDALRGVPVLRKPYQAAELQTSVRELYRMDLTRTLGLVDRHIARSWENIKRQALLVSRLAAQGHDAQLGEQLLRAYEQTLSLLESRRSSVLDALQRQGWSGELEALAVHRL